MDTFVIVLIVILVIVFIGQKAFFSESFKNTNETIKLYVFVSSSCPHCHTYLNKQHKNVSSLIQSKGLEAIIVQSDSSKKSSDLFTKYNVQFVPTGIFVKGDMVYENLGSNITSQTVNQVLENLS